jgi:hypothetical protein
LGLAVFIVLHGIAGIPSLDVGQWDHPNARRRHLSGTFVFDRRRYACAVGTA